MRFLGVLGWALLFIACSTGMKYPYFGLDMPSPCYEQGTLVGIDENGDPDPDLNEPLLNCGKFGDCMVLKTETYERVLTDLYTCQESLKACEEN